MDNRLKMPVSYVSALDDRCGDPPPFQPGADMRMLGQQSDTSSSPSGRSRRRGGSLSTNLTNGATRLAGAGAGHG